MTVDVHGHLGHPEAMRRYPMPHTFGLVEDMILGKLSRGVRVTVIGSPTGATVPPLGVANHGRLEDEFSRQREWVAGLVDRYPEHLRAYVFVNPFGGAAHLERVAQSVRQPQFVGLISHTSVAGRHLDAPEAEDFFAFAAEAGVPVLLHPPASPVAAVGRDHLMLVEQLGRFSDVTIGLACCLLGGWLDRFPGLKLVGTTAGGALGLLAEKLDQVAPRADRDAGAGLAGPRPGAGGARGNGGPPRLMRRLAALAEPPSSYLRRFWVDTSTPSPTAIDLALRVFGPDRVLFGTDSPPLPHAEVSAALDLLNRPSVPAPARDAIREQNAVALFGDALPPATTTRATPRAAARPTLVAGYPGPAPRTDPDKANGSTPARRGPVPDRPGG